MSTPNRTIIILGAGPGIGNHLASEFLSRSFTHAVLLSRNAARLEQDKAFVLSKANRPVKVDTLTLDLSDLPSVHPTLDKVESLAAAAGSQIEAVVFNAARIVASSVLDVKLSDIELDFRTTNLALYAVAQWTIPRLVNLASSNSSFKPSLFVTNSHLPWDPSPDLLSLSLVKASQRNMVQSFARAFEGKGVHFGLISVEGVVAPENKNLNPKNIAEKTWGFYEAGEGIDVRITE